MTGCVFTGELGFFFVVLIWPTLPQWRKFQVVINKATDSWNKRPIYHLNGYTEDKTHMDHKRSQYGVFLYFPVNPENYSAFSQAPTMWHSLNTGYHLQCSPQLVHSAIFHIHRSYGSADLKIMDIVKTFWKYLEKFLIRLKKKF